LKNIREKEGCMFSMAEKRERRRGERKKEERKIRTWLKEEKKK